MRARWYDPGSGQFLSVDPAVAQTGAAYSYAGDNPTDNSDPTGQFSICGPFGIGCISVNPVAGAEGAANFFAGFANAATFGQLGISQPFCGPGLNASYDIGEGDFAAEAIAATGGLAAGVGGGAADAGSVESAITALDGGRSAGVYTVSSPDELESLYGELSAGGSPVEGSYPGESVELPDGTRVGIRPTSGSGGPTIDVRLPDGTNLKVHVSP